MSDLPSAEPSDERPSVPAVPKRRAKPSSSDKSSDTDLEKNLQDLGRLGYWLGSKDNAPVYIAGIIAILALIGTIAVSILEPANASDKADLVKGLLAVVISALSFIGGASGRGR